MTPGGTGKDPAAHKKRNFNFNEEENMCTALQVVGTYRLDFFSETLKKKTASGTAAAAAIVAMSGYKV